MHLFIYFLLPAIVSFAVLYTLVIVYEDKHHDVFQILTIIAIALTNLGYLAIAVSHDVETALLANKIAYIAGAWLPFFVVMIVAKLCGIRISVYVMGLMAPINLLVFILALSTGYSNVFYESASIVTVHGVTSLKVVYAPGHLVFYAMLAIETLCAVGMIVYACFFKHRSIPVHSVVLTLFAMLAPRIAYTIEFVLNTGITLMPILYAISSLLFVLSYSEVNLHDIALLIASAQEKSRLDENYDVHGYIAFDAKKRLVSFNEQAAEFFPVLLTSRIDSCIDEATGLYQNIVSKLDDTQSFIDELKVDNDVFIKVNVIPPKKKKGLFLRKNYLVELTYLVELVDNTFEHNYMSLQQDFNTVLQTEVNRQVEHIKAVYDSVISSMSLIIANRDDSTGGHIERTSKCVKVFLDALQKSEYKLSPVFCKNVEKAAPLHDIGKIGVDDAILRKPGKFTEEEYDLMKSHPARGAEIIEQVLHETEDETFKAIAINVAHYHHERWDGQGYPTSISGEHIPLEARIMALPDVFDALVSVRAYKEAFSYDVAFEIIKSSIGTQFDPSLGKIFLSIRPELEELYDTLDKDTLASLGV